MSEDNTLLSAGAIDNVAALAEKAMAKVITIGGREYSTTHLYDPREEDPAPRPIELHTLQSFADFTKDKAESEDHYRDGKGLFVHVQDPTTVRLVTGIFGEFNQRVTLAACNATTPNFPFGQYQSPEPFNIALQTMFEDAADRPKVLALVGNLRDEQVQTYEDDGVTQAATARKGLSMAATIQVPNPVQLIPFRSFAEIDQVGSPFVLRLKGGGEGKLPSCALFEADGGLWRLEAIKRIRAWLEGELGDSVAIYG